MRVLTRYIMFILERIRSVSVRIFRNAKQNYAYVLHHRRLKVRCKRVSIRQLIWIFFFVMAKKALFVPFFLAWTILLVGCQFCYCVELSVRVLVRFYVPFISNAQMDTVSHINQFGFCFVFPSLRNSYSDFTSLSLFFFKTTKRTTTAFYILFMFKPKYVQFYNNFVNASVNDWVGIDK